MIDSLRQFVMGRPARDAAALVTRPLETIWAFCLCALVGCASAPTGTLISSSTPLVAPVHAISSDTIIFLGVEFPGAGATLGFHHDGLLKVRQFPVYMTGELQNQWGGGLRDVAFNIMTASGYRLRQVSPLFNQVQSYEGVHYAVAGKLTTLAVDTYAPLAGGRTSVQLSVDWEVLDVSTRNVVFRRQTSGSASVGGTSGSAVSYAFRAALLVLVSDNSFARVFMSRVEPPPLRVAQVVPVNWRRPIPGASELLTIRRTSQNVALNPSALARAISATVTIVGDQGSGSAFTITRDGLALTNYHVIARQQSLQARLSSGREVAVRLIRADSAADVALIEVACDSQCYTIELDAVLSVEVGSEVYAVGTPMSDALSNTATRGIVSGIRLDRGITLVQTDAAINPGNSGGPLVDSQSGKACAIVTFKLTGRAEGLGFGIAVQDAIRILGIRYLLEPTVPSRR